MVRKLYDWVLHWAETPYGVPALFMLSFAESSFFPVPPDVLLIALAVSLPKRSFRYAAICTAASVIGGMLGYAIGAFAREALALPIIEFYGAQEHMRHVEAVYSQWGFWAVFTAGLTPIPYKVFTIAAGILSQNFPGFVLASIFGRGLRFFVVGGLIYLFGPKIKDFIDKYFNLLAVAFVILLVGGFVVLKFVLHR